MLKPAEGINIFRATAAEFTAEGTTYVLGAGDFGYETDTGNCKLGDGVTVWNSLAYFTPDNSNATPTELERFNDVSGYTETVTAAGALSVSKKVSNLALVGAGAVTLAVPDGTMLGQIKMIEMTVDNGDVTLALTNVEGGTAASTATFDAVGEKLILVAAAGKWVVIKQQGVTLS